MMTEETLNLYAYNINSIELNRTGIIIVAAKDSKSAYEFLCERYKRYDIKFDKDIRNIYPKSNEKESIVYKNIWDI